VLGRRNPARRTGGCCWYNAPIPILPSFLVIVIVIELSTCPEAKEPMVSFFQPCFGRHSPNIDTNSDIAVQGAEEEEGGCLGLGLRRLLNFCTA
jgi:hypothetical protein